MYLLMTQQFEHVNKLTWFLEELGSGAGVLLWTAGLYCEVTGASGLFGDTPVAVQSFT